MVMQCVMIEYKFINILQVFFEFEKNWIFLSYYLVEDLFLVKLNLQDCIFFSYNYEDLNLVL